MPAVWHSAVLMLCVKAEITMQDAIVHQDTEETPMLPAQDQNVLWMMNVHKYWHVEMSTVLTHVTVHQMQSALWGLTELDANVHLVTLVTHTQEDAI